MILFPDCWVADPDGVQLVATPVGAVCVECEKPIQSGDRGLYIPCIGDIDEFVKPWHRECFLNNIGALPGAEVCPRCGGRHA